jgi:putative ABC transport system substrate-binding protein
LAARSLISKAFQDAVRDRVDALVAARNNVLAAHESKIANLAIKYRLPSTLERSSYPEAGGLMTYSSNDVEAFRRAAVYVDKILKGGNPLNCRSSS